VKADAAARNEAMAPYNHPPRLEAVLGPGAVSIGQGPGRSLHVLSRRAGHFPRRVSLSRGPGRSLYG
jgi:hypothetical protein